MQLVHTLGMISSVVYSVHNQDHAAFNSFFLLYLQNHLLPRTLCHLPMNTSHWVSFGKYRTVLSLLFLSLKTHISFKKRLIEFIRFYPCSPSLKVDMRCRVCKHTKSHSRYLFLAGHKSPTMTQVPTVQTAKLWNDCCRPSTLLLTSAENLTLTHSRLCVLLQTPLCRTLKLCPLFSPLRLTLRQETTQVSKQHRYCTRTQTL